MTAARRSTTATTPRPAPLPSARELAAKWQTAPGQLWTIPSAHGGAHRILCGDSTRAADVQRLMGDERAVWCWTDPPYGVDYERTTPEGYAVANDNAQGLPALLGDAFQAANDNALVEGAPIYVAHPSGPAAVVFGQTFQAVGWKFHQTLVWAKDTFVLGHSDYHFAHECLLYGWKLGARHRWYGGRKQRSVLLHPRPRRNEGHPTVKPLSLIVECLENSSRPGDLGYEPFAGSGSTVVAAETAGRRCYAIELMPPFVAVALERLSRLGLEPELTDPGPAAVRGPKPGLTWGTAESEGAKVLPLRRRRS